MSAGETIIGEGFLCLRIITEGPIKIMKPMSEVPIIKSAGEHAGGQFELFKRFVEASGQALGMSHLDGQIFYANSNLCRLLDVKKPENLYEKNVFAYYLPEAVTYLKEEVLPLVRRERRWSGELVLVSEQGRKTPTIQNIYLIQDNEGNPLCLANMIVDLSDPNIKAGLF